MKTKIIFLILFSAMVISGHSQTGSNAPEPVKNTGYWIAISQPGERLQIVKTTDISELTVLSEVYFPGNCVDFTKELSASPYFAIENGKKQFYVELKRINKNGKYRRMSNREFKQTHMHQSLSNNYE